MDVEDDLAAAKTGHLPFDSGDHALTLGARLMTLANLMRRITAARFGRSFDLTLVEGWIVSRLGLHAPQSLDELAWQNGLAKSQMSKSVKGLVARGLVDRARGAAGSGEVALALTAAGRAVFDEIARRAPEYNARLADGLDAADIDALLRRVETLTANSRRNLRAELSKDDAHDP